MLVSPAWVALTVGLAAVLVRSRDLDGG